MKLKHVLSLMAAVVGVAFGVPRYKCGTTAIVTLSKLPTIYTIKYHKTFKCRYAKDKDWVVCRIGEVDTQTYAYALINIKKKEAYGGVRFTGLSPYSRQRGAEINTILTAAKKKGYNCDWNYAGKLIGKPVACMSVNPKAICHQYKK